MLVPEGQGDGLVSIAAALLPQWPDFTPQILTKEQGITMHT